MNTSEDNLDMTLQTDDLVAGTVLEQKYRILSVIGRGGMATVYHARHATLQEDVAIKVLNMKLAEADNELQRFRNEARTLQLIAHPNVVRVMAFGVTDGNPYMVMEYVQGTPLDKDLKQHGAISPTRSAAIFKEICSGLQAAHDKQIIHRDLKPANILLSNSGAKIVDFGIAKLSNTDAGLNQQFTRTGILTGTPLYMSPERCRNEPEDKRSDIYSLGCLLFECLTGSPPFTGETPLAVLAQHLNDEVTMPSDKHIGAPLWAVITKCMQKEPTLRYSSASEVARALDDILIEDSLVRYKSASGKPRLKSLLFIAAASILAFAGTGIGIHQLRHAQSVIPIAAVVPQTERKMAKGYETFSFRIREPFRPDGVSDQFFYKLTKVLFSRPSQGEVIRQVCDPDGGPKLSPGERSMLLEAYSNYLAHEGSRHFLKQRYTDAVHSYLAALSEIGSMKEQQREDMRLARMDVLTRLGATYFCLNQLQKAEAAFTDAIAISKERPLVANQSFDLEFQLTLATAGLAAIHYDKAKPKSASSEEERSLGCHFIRQCRELLRKKPADFNLSEKQTAELDVIIDNLFKSGTQGERHYNEIMEYFGRRRKKNRANSDQMTCSPLSCDSFNSCTHGS